MHSLFRSRVLFIAVFLVSLLLALHYSDTAVSFLLLYSLILLAALAAGSVLAAPLLIRVEPVEAAPHVFKSEPLCYRVTVRNRGWIPYSHVRLQYFHQEQLGISNEAVAVPARGEITVEHTLRFPYRGVYQLGVKSYTVADFWGLVQRTFPSPRPSTVMVFPTCGQDMALELKTRLQNRAAFQYGFYNEELADVSDIRGYTQSDDYKKIHWKLSARRRELLVKEYESPEPIRTMLFLETASLPLKGEPRLAFEDAMAGGAAGLLQSCLQNRMPVDFTYGAGDGARLRIDPVQELTPVYQLLAELPFRDKRSALSSFVETAASSRRPVQLLLLLSRLDDGVARKLRDCLSLGHHVDLYYFSREAPPLFAVPGYSSGDVALPDGAAPLLEALQAAGATVHCIFAGESTLPGDGGTEAEYR